MPTIGSAQTDSLSVIGPAQISSMSAIGPAQTGSKSVRGPGLLALDKGTCHFPDTIIRAVPCTMHAAQTSEEATGPSRCLKAICTLVLKNEQVAKIKAC